MYRMASRKGRDSLQREKFLQTELRDELWAVISRVLERCPMTITELRPKNFLQSQLQDELWAIIGHAKYDDLTVATIVGVLEFLKWNLINRSDS